MYFKKMIGEKCYLSPVDVNDAEKFTEWLNDLEVTQNLTLYPHIISLTNEKESLEHLAKSHTYSIIDINTGELIGNCGYMDLDHINQTGEVGIFIGNIKYWSIGYGTEALTLLLDYGFKALNLHNIFLKVYSFNERAIKCYKKIGFKTIGKRREALLRGKDRYDIIFMDIVHNEFYAGRQ
ncbi:MAG: GNAT family N-acetyltransferase [Treponema sp.]|nr:GNAT family N-acetyltransferase [Treponema sp.]